MRLVSIILPAYNESKSISTVLENLIAYLGAELLKIGLRAEIIVVDDGSVDGTQSVLEKFSGRVKILRHEKNLGKGAALKTGFADSKGEYVVFYDAGGDYHPKYIVEFLKLIQAGADAVLGDKYSPGMHYPKYRIVVGKAVNSLIRGIFHVPFSDTQAGIKAFAREPLERYIHMPASDGYLFDAELVSHMYKNGCRMIRRPAEVNYNPGTGKNFLEKTSDVFKDIIAFIVK